ncbi:hypothetical protein [Chryseosolibacter indicus]|uniref:Uncharacterized protein n=1 Tax=Chryseosolibacter indicus TaxID=2782351 RepID=A0ABS5VL67_9BACT|nr:hypothetical protein [Chryseosolibacter indicus]MBT1702182.1 hypothetical protein [Chryseosolibacter indicus]
MQNTDSEKDSVILSVEKIIDLVRSTRNDLIKEYLKDEVLMFSYKQKYGKEVTTVKKEFLKRDLKDLLISPVDLVHYSKLITHIKETNIPVLSEKEKELFYSEIDMIFQKYSF